MAYSKQPMNMSYKEKISGYKKLLIVILVLFILNIIPVIICAITKNKIVHSNDYKDNYNMMYNKAANSQELINSYEELVGKTEKGEFSDSTKTAQVTACIIVLVILLIILLIASAVVYGEIRKFKKFIPNSSSAYNF
jgi:uncharacterized membrane protein